MPSDAVEQLADDLDAFWQHYRPCFRTRTRDTSDCARTFWRGQSALEDQRKFANIDRRLNRRDDQPLQHFMSESPWQSHAVFQQMERTFATKPALELVMIQRAQANGLPFETVACDELYGRNRDLQAQLDEMHLSYAAQVPADTQVYLQAPQVGLPSDIGSGRRHTRWRVQSQQKPYTVYAIGRRAATVWQRVQVRPIERGVIEAEFAVVPVWTLTPTSQVRAEWLVIRRDSDGRLSYSLLNGAADTPAPILIERTCWRYYTERTYEDAKSE